MSDSYTQKDIDRAWAWFKQREELIKRNAAPNGYCYPAIGLDIENPGRWSPANWNWFFVKIGIGDFVIMDPAALSRRKYSAFDPAHSPADSNDGS